MKTQISEVRTKLEEALQVLKDAERGDLAEFFEDYFERLKGNIEARDLLFQNKILGYEYKLYELAYKEYASRDSTLDLNKTINGSFIGDDVVRLLRDEVSERFDKIDIRFVDLTRREVRTVDKTYILKHLSRKCDKSGTKGNGWMVDLSDAKPQKLGKDVSNGNF